MIPIPTPDNVPIDVLRALQLATMGERYSAMLLATPVAWNLTGLASAPTVKAHFAMLQSHYLTRANELLPPNWLACRGILPDRLLLMEGETVIEWFKEETKGLKQ